MKKQDLLKQVRSMPNLERAWRTIQDNGRTSKSDKVRAEIAEFQEEASSKLRSLSYRLARGKFKFPKAKGVPLPKSGANGKPTGKVRSIVLAPIESRIVQRAVLNVLVEVPDLKPFVKTKYSYGGIRSEKKKVVGGVKLPRSERASAVPAAIQAVLAAISDGARYVACGDIQAFFTKISKPQAISIVLDSTGDVEFVNFFRQAIHVELENIDLLKRYDADWPTHEIGVAQGNSLSPLIGNMVLAEFDREMNEGDCRCIRYIDDIIILGPSEKAVNSRLRRANLILSDIGMNLSPEKTSKGATSIDSGFDFLGINICPGSIRPSQKAQQKFLASVDELFNEGRKSLTLANEGKRSNRRSTLIGTLKTLDGMIDGWGKHYWFCNDKQSWINIDNKISDKISQFIAFYTYIRKDSPADSRMSLLGVSELTHIEREPFSYPKTK